MTFTQMTLEESLNTIVGSYHRKITCSECEENDLDTEMTVMQVTPCLVESTVRVNFTCPVCGTTASGVFYPTESRTARPNDLKRLTI